MSFLETENRPTVIHGVIPSSVIPSLCILATKRGTNITNNLAPILMPNSSKSSCLVRALLIENTRRRRYLNKAQDINDSTLMRIA